MVTRTEELGSEDARATGTAKETKGKYEQQIVVDDGHTANLGGAELTHHQIVQHGNKIGDKTLEDDRERNGQGFAVKCPVANVSLKHGTASFSYLC
jgi:hypothetical protein